MTLFLSCCFECSFLAATAQLNKPVLQNNCNSIFTSLMSVTPTCSWPGTYGSRALLESTACGDDDLVKLKSA